MRKAILLFTVMALALILASGTALAALVMGTDNADTLVGTSSADQITGKGGNDTLKGMAGNDVYYFDEGWGYDTLVEPLKVGKKSGGSDTLSFSQDDQDVRVLLIRQWGSGWSQASSLIRSDFIYLGPSAVVENATGGRGQDSIVGGSDRNTLQPGGGGYDDLRDFGGHNDGPGGQPELPVSNDTFKGFESNTGTDSVWDWGGTADLVDLRPFGASEVYVDAVDLDGNGSTRESLQIVTGTSTQVLVLGHFGEFGDYTSRTGQQGRIEQLLFSDGTFSGVGTAGINSSSSAASASSEEESADTVEALINASKERSEKTSEGAELEKAAKKLLNEAQKNAPEDPLAQLPSVREGES